MASLKELDKMVNGMNLKDMPLHHVLKDALVVSTKGYLYPKMKR
jgi:hypothetical protein